MDPTSGLSIAWRHRHQIILRRHHKEPVPWRWRFGALSYVQRSAHVGFGEPIVMLSVCASEATGFATQKYCVGLHECARSTSRGGLRVLALKGLGGQPAT